jgi:tRNA A37 threonylcarbamoyladenosine biosynthesis protein TsaE
MTIDEFIFRVEQEVGFPPTREQHLAVDCFTRFLACREGQPVMILRGSAGTGKTTLASAMVRTLKRLGQKMVLLAPTGRAAKVFSLNSGEQASTIHRRIYRQKSLEGGFSLGFNSLRNALFFVDEASMISTGNSSLFGDGSLLGSSLLDDLVQFVYGGPGDCRMILIGDPAQLPPVGEEEAPALEAEVLRNYGLRVFESTLNEVVRQEEESGILWNATQIRSFLPEPNGLEELQEPRLSPLDIALRIKMFADVRRVPGDELIESLNTSYSHVGTDETIVVTRSNKRANIYNMGIRNSILGREEELTTGDRLMVVKNKYGLPQPPLQGEGSSGAADSSSSGGGAAGSEGLDFIANGDQAVVQRVRNVHELYGFRFANVWLQFPDYDDYELQSLVMLDTLTTEAPALTREQSEQLFNKVMEDYADVRPKSERLKKLKEDEHYNALQVKFAYAVTCHKAQGGQWAHVYIDQGYVTSEMLDADYVHWLYTAFTRATECVFLVNWP